MIFILSLLSCTLLSDEKIFLTKIVERLLLGMFEEARAAVGRSRRMSQDAIGTPGLGDSTYPTFLRRETICNTLRNAALATGA